jgi:arginyl-tRNA synthetase
MVSDAVTTAGTTTDTTPSAGATPTALSGTVAVEDAKAGGAIRDALRGLGFGERRFDLRPIPFAGTWGAATSVCRALASEVILRELEERGELEGLSKKETKRRVNDAVPERAQTLAEQVAAQIMSSGVGFSQVEAVNGYVNISFDANAVAVGLIREVLDRGAGYGRGEPKTERVMVEHSQLNTHKAAHVGHLRNICLGVAVINIVEAAGYPTIPATYIGDIGRHVIQCLWCYEQFHKGEEPASIAARGRWLGDLYAESERRMKFRQDALHLLRLLSQEDPTFVEAIDRMLKYLVRKNADGEDIAYLLGRVTHAQEIKEDQLRRDDVIPMFWPIVGDQLRNEVEHPKPVVLADDETAPTTTPEERLARWSALAEHIDDWWPQVPRWREEVNETFQRWERKDPDFVALWEETRSWSLTDLRQVFDQLGATFDVWFYESEVEEPGRAIVHELLERGIAEISNGLPVVKIDEKLGLEYETYRTLPILRSDGTTLYATKDLALTRQKFDEYGVDLALWVVDVRQSLYFDQVLKILELAGFQQAAQAKHLGYEFVSLPEGAISSRKGTAPLFEDIRDAVVGRARSIIEEKNPDLADEVKGRVAWQVGIGSLKYAMLARDITKVVVFDLDEALSFDGHAAPYIQYAHARACRILERAELAEDDVRATVDNVVFETLDPTELALVQIIAALPDEIGRAAAEYRPLLLTNYVYELAKAFNDFYHACPVLSSEEPTRTARLALVAATRRALANGLNVLGIEAPEEM